MSQIPYRAQFNEKMGKCQDKHLFNYLQSHFEEDDKISVIRVPGMDSLERWKIKEGKPEKLWRQGVSHHPDDELVVFRFFDPDA